MLGRDVRAPPEKVSERTKGVSHGTEAAVTEETLICGENLAECDRDGTMARIQLDDEGNTKVGLRGLHSQKQHEQRPQNGVKGRQDGTLEGLHLREEVNTKVGL
ncbi:hypothetical protein VNO78_23621 [Psophocarpus tetragonolobus]|uniref:Uncharacterized protein n=1 Tax=Psophocarpus tetragonolobus TaxID=3891 RepID=A0AAN9S6Z6_PSOTE